MSALMAIAPARAPTTTVLMSVVSVPPIMALSDCRMMIDTRTEMKNDEIHALACTRPHYLKGGRALCTSVRTQRAG